MKMDATELLTSGFQVDIAMLIGGIVFGIIGLYLFRHGRRNQVIRNVVIGLILMIYPYFVSEKKLFWFVGLVLLLWAYLKRHSDDIF